MEELELTDSVETDKVCINGKVPPSSREKQNLS